MISAVILTKNNQRTLKKVLKAVEDFSEVIIIDTGSSDNTLKIAQTFPNVKIFKKSFTSFGKLRNEGSNYASNHWILALDSDEVLSKQLKDEILSLNFNNNTLYSLPFLNFYQGKLIKCCGWYPESHIRLYHKNFTKFSEDLVHERLIEKDAKIQKLSNPVYHFSYHHTDDFLLKMHRYSSLFAEQYKNKKKSSVKKALFHGLFAFIKAYLLKKGIFYGKTGFLISCYQANTAFYKYVKLAEKNDPHPSLSSD